jgi:hypothetical protein
MEVVGHVGKKGAPWLQLANEFECLFQRSVAGVGPFAQRIDNDNVKVLEQREAAFRDAAHIGKVSGIAKAEARDLNPSVGERDAVEDRSLHLD